MSIWRYKGTGEIDQKRLRNKLKSNKTGINATDIPGFRIND